MRTESLRPEDVKQTWYIVDAKGKVLGRLAAGIASYLKGKHRPDYTPHVDMGDFIVVINAKDIQVTGNKLEDKIYYHHSEYIGGIKEISLNKLLKSHPERALEHAVKGMLPKNSLGSKMYRRLKVYSGSEHPHAAQQPISLNFDDIRE